ncbi:MAG: hypothetical protein JXR63_00980 [Spirochaetales bacterium]|nr:hypothetical protein [Spirochaetales bacterium]
MVKKILRLVNDQFYTSELDTESCDESIYLMIDGVKHFERRGGYSKPEDICLRAGNYLFLQKKVPVDLKEDEFKDVQSFAVWKGFSLGEKTFSRIIEEGSSYEYQLLIELKEDSNLLNFI